MKNSRRIYVTIVIDIDFIKVFVGVIKGQDLFMETQSYIWKKNVLQMEKLQPGVQCNFEHPAGGSRPSEEKWCHLCGGN